MMRGLCLGVARPAAPFIASGAFSPEDIASLAEMKYFSDLTKLWQENTKATQVSADGQTIGYASDFVSASNDVLQATAAARPLYKTSGGLHWALFDGTDDVLSAASHNLPVGANTCHIIACIEATASTSGVYHSGYGTTATNTGRRAGFASNIATRVESIGTAAFQGGFGNTVAQVHVYEAVFTSTHIKTAVDGAAFTQTSYTSMNTGAGPFNLGSGVSSGFSPIKLFAHNTFTAELTGDDRTNMVTWSAAKGGKVL